MNNIIPFFIFRSNTAIFTRKWKLRNEHLTKLHRPQLVRKAMLQNESYVRAAWRQDDDCSVDRFSLRPLLAVCSSLGDEHVAKTSFSWEILKSESACTRGGWLKKEFFTILWTRQKCFSYNFLNKWEDVAITTTQPQHRVPLLPAYPPIHPGDERGNGELQSQLVYVYSAGLNDGQHNFEYRV